MSLKKSAVKGVFWSALDSWGNRVLSFVIFFVLVRLLGPKTFGLVALAGVFQSFMQVFLDQGLSQAIVQRHDLKDEHLDTAFWTNILTAVLLTGISNIASDWVALLFKEPSISLIIRYLSIAFILTAFCSVQQAILLRNLDFKSLALRSLAATVLSGIVGIVTAFLGYGVWSLVAQQLSYSLGQAITLWKVSEWRPKLRFSGQHFQELFSFGINILGLRALHFVSRRSDDLLIGYYLGPVALGYYSVAYKLLLVMIELLSGVVDKVSMPTFAKLQTNIPKLRDAFYKVTWSTSVLTFPCFLAMSMLSSSIVLVFFGSQWVQSIPVMQVLALSGISATIISYNSSLLKALGKPGLLLGLSSLSTLLSVISFLVVVKWGILAVALAFVIRGFVWAPVPILVTRSRLKTDLYKYFSLFLTPLIASLIMALVIILTKAIFENYLNDLMLTIVCILYGVYTYLTVMLLIDPSFAKMLLKLQVKFKKT
jgi:O-antigen/teichoic acid export membrane protein